MTISRKSLRSRKVQAEHLPKAPYIKVAVTADNISCSLKSNSSHCMTAVAVTVACNKRKIDCTHVSIDTQTIRFSDPAKGLRYVYLTPRVAQSAILQWDQGYKVEPFDFVLSGGAVHAMNVSNAKDKHAKKIARTMKLKLKNPRFRPGSSGKIPRVVGGREPPSVSQRREFGLRAYGGPAGQVRAA